MKHYGIVDDSVAHDCVFGPWERSALAGTPHRKCTVAGCQVVSLDGDDEEEDDEERCSACGHALTFQKDGHPYRCGHCGHSKHRGVQFVAFDERADGARGWVVRDTFREGSPMESRHDREADADAEAARLNATVIYLVEKEEERDQGFEVQGRHYDWEER